MNANLCAICITAIVITFIICARDWAVEVEKGEHVRNLLRLQQGMGLTQDPYLKPSIQIQPGRETNL